MLKSTDSRRSRGTLRSVFVVFAALFGTGAAGQQSAPAPPQPVPVQQPPFRGGTNFIRVDVYPTRNGVPVEDLTAADFEVAEDGVPQKVESFEHVVVRPAGPQDSRVEPSSATRGNQLAADPHRRVFVIFLDTVHVSVESSHHIKEPLIDLMTNMLGPDDLVGVMTPDMSADQISFARKTEAIEEGLRKNWAWGRRHTIQRDEEEFKYEECFPPVPPEPGPTSALARALIDRRRERIVLDTLHEMILHLGAIREGRTAVVAVTEGWLLYRPSPNLTNLRTDPLTGERIDPVPGSPQPIGVGPGGVLTTKDPHRAYPTERQQCEVARMELAMTDNTPLFRDILGEANRANVSFYPIDPRGLPAFDTPIGPEPPLPIDVDRAVLTTRIENLRVLADNTDGIAFVNSNNLKAQMQRLAADLTSYYLLGYSSTNTRLDGGFRKIKVRVKKPGVEVRARNGYRAATAPEVNAARTAAPAPGPNAAVDKALGTLAREIRSSAPEPERAKSIDVAGEPIIFRRGPTTGNQLQRATGKQFSRTERLHIEMLPGETSNWTGALLDKMGKTLPIPVPTGERIDAATGQRWLTADLVLAPLGTGDYVIELTAKRAGQEQKILKAIRVTQ